MRAHKDTNSQSWPPFSLVSIFIEGLETVADFLASVIMHNRNNPYERQNKAIKGYHSEGLNLIIAQKIGF